MRGSDEQNNLLFRWFVGLRIDDAVQVPTVFSRYRDRLLTTDVARQFLASILADRRWRRCFRTSVSP